MYKNILIISDNQYMCSQFLNLLTKNDYYSVNWTFAISPFSDINEFVLNDDIEIKVINLKEDNVITEIINTYDLVFSIHCKQLFPKRLVNKVKCINIHPGYNPINRGWYPQVFAIINNLPTGATIHEIDEHLDHGPIISREFVDKEITDTSESLYAKIVAKELEILEKNIKSIIEGSYKTIFPENEGNLFFKSDFKELCHIKSDEKMNVSEFVNRIRALTHGNFKNAYFIDPETQKKIYLSINLSIEN